MCQKSTASIYQQLEAMPRRQTLGKFQALPRHLLCPKNPVACITQAGQDVAVVIELAVNGGGVKGHVRMSQLQRGDAFWASQQANELDGFGLESF